MVKVWRRGEKRRKGYSGGEGEKGRVMVGRWDNRRKDYSREERRVIVGRGENRRKGYNGEERREGRVIMGRREEKEGL